MAKCDNCREEIDGPAYANPSELSENLCGYCYGQVKCVTNCRNTIST